MAKNLTKAISKLHLDKRGDIEYHPTVDTHKSRERFIKSVERAVRSSMEYKDYIAFLKEFVDFDKCAFFNNIGKDNANGGKVRIEIHHEPLTLYDICNIVLEKYIDTGMELDELLIADEVLELHYSNMVGLIPLSVTLHQVRHNNPDKLPIPLTMIYGKYSDFLEEYADYIDDAIFDKLERLAKETEELTPEAYDAIIKNFLYIEVEGVADLEKMETAADKIVAA